MALVDLESGLGHLPPEQRLRSRRFLPTGLLDALGAAANVYRAAADLDVRMRQAAKAGDPDQVDGGIEPLRDLARKVDREGRVALGYLEDATEADQARARELGLPTTIDREAIWAIRRGLEVRADLVDVDALVTRTSRLRPQVDTRLFAVFRLLAHLSAVPTPDITPIKQFTQRLSNALALEAHLARNPPVRTAGLAPLFVGIDTVRTLLSNVAGLDLRDADLSDVPLVGVLWSSATRWPPGWQDRIEVASVPVGDDQFQITDWGTGRAATDVSHMPKLA